jgi:hypothetical protein
MPKRFSPELVSRVIKMNEQAFLQYEIAGQLGIGLTSVTKILKKHNERVYESLVKSHVAERGRQLKLLGWMFRECMLEWERSKKTQTRTTKTVEEGKGVKGGKAAKVAVEERESLGNVNYIDRMQAILGAMREVLLMDKFARRDEGENPGAGDHDVTKALEDIARIAESVRAGRMPESNGVLPTAVLDDDDEDETG